MTLRLRIFDFDGRPASLTMWPSRHTAAIRFYNADGSVKWGPVVSAEDIVLRGNMRVSLYFPVMFEIMDGCEIETCETLAKKMRVYAAAVHHAVMLALEEQP